MTPELPKSGKAANAAFDVFDVWQAVEKITASEDFGRAGRLGQLLRYIITEELEGRGGRLKAYAIATQVLGRNADFDASQDSIVRVEMARLRTALKLFYARPNDVAVRIDIPKGGYRPTILPVPEAVAGGRERTGSKGSQLPAASGGPSGSEEKASRGRRILVTFAGLAACLAILAYLQVLARRTAPVSPPVAVLAPLVLVSPVTISSTNPAMKSYERGLKGELVGELSSYSWLSVAYRSEAQAIGTATDPRSVYTVSMNIVVDGGKYSSITTLQDAATGRVRWSHADKGALPENQVFPLLASAARRIAAEIGQPLGAVTRAELEETPLDSSAGNYACLLRLREYLSDWTPAGRDAFQTCARAQPRSGDALGLGLSAFASVDAARFAGGSDRSEQLAAARRDIDAALVFRPRSYLVLSTAAQVHACQNDKAQFDAYSDEIIRSRSNDPTALGHVAAIRAFAFNDREPAMELARKAQAIALGPQPAAELVLALDEFMREDMVAVVRRLEPLPRIQAPIATVLLAAAYGDLGNAASLAKLRGSIGGSLLPDNEQIRRYVASECWSDTVRLRIDAALAKASGL